MYGRLCAIAPGRRPWWSLLPPIWRPLPGSSRGLAGSRETGAPKLRRGGDTALSAVAQEPQIEQKTLHDEAKDSYLSVSRGRHADGARNALDMHALLVWAQNRDVNAS